MFRLGAFGLFCYADSEGRVALAPLISSRVRTRRMGKAEATRRPVLRLPPASSEM